jgi:hypothetical protein
VQLEIAVSQKVQLVIEVTMHSRLDGCRTGPYARTAKKGGQKPEDPATVTPKVHCAAWSGFPWRHGGPKDRTMVALIFKHFGKGRNTVRPK